VSAKKAKSPRVLVLRTAGTNCDQETVFAFRYFGANVDLVHIHRLFNGEVKLKDYHILAFPGGFTYGDDIMSGRILANELRLRLGDEIRTFIDEGKLILGICNGFQVLVRAGILPGSGSAFKQTVSLTHNDSAKFEDRWTHLRGRSSSVWTEGLDDVLYIPVAHAEGKFVVSESVLIDRLRKNGQIAFQYCDEKGTPTDQYPLNPNGSAGQVAGMTDATGRVLGMMPHPERHFFFEHHPSWTRIERKGDLGQGARLFENGVKYVEKNFLNSSVEAHV